MKILEVKDLSVTDPKTKEQIVNNISFHVKKNSCLGIVGESGSGKSMTCRSILGLTNPSLQVSGTVFFQGQNIINSSHKVLREIRGKKICMIIQDAMGAFNPLYTIGYQLIETLVENLGCSKKDAAVTGVNSLKKMRIKNPEEVMLKYPHQLSGGMLQRCMIALALSLNPDIIIADEPTTALDAINQYEIVEEFKRIKENEGTSLIFISHDLGVVQKLADKVLVMKDGQCVEHGEAGEVFSNPQHEYTKYLVDTRRKLAKAFSGAIERG